MSNTSKRDEIHVSSRSIYVQISHACPICKKIFKHSKKFSSPYALLYHLNSHTKEDEYNAGVHKEDIRRIIRTIVRAYEVGVLWA